MHGKASPLAIRLAATILTLTFCCSTAWAQGSYQVIFNFGATPSQAYQPWSGVVLDARGNIYGTTEWGGLQGNGTVYQLLRNNGNWTYATLHSFGYYDPGSAPVTTLVRDQLGRLYGTDTGQVFELRPNTSVSWAFSSLHNFTGGADGACNDLCSVSMDSAGNLYGSTPAGGANNAGVIFMIGTGGYSVLYNFTGGDDGGYGVGQIAFDNQGNIYGTTVQGGMYGDGVVYQMSPNGTYTVLHNFSGGSADGSQPWGGLILARDGNLYGTTANGGSGEGGTVFRLTPNGDGTWTESVICSFQQVGDGFAPMAVPTMDASGNLWGTTTCGIEPNCNGTIYELTQSNGEWTQTTIHAFQGPPNDGNNPIYVPVAIDSAGNIYGTTTMGGIYDGNGEGFGTVWEYTP